MQSDKERNRTNKNIKTLSEASPIGNSDSSPIECLDPPQKSVEVLLIEPFYGGSHKQLIDILEKHISESRLITLKAKKWHWRARCGALIMSNMIPKPITTEHTLFCSSVLSLAELIGLRSDLSSLRKIVYFHENQMVYPIREIKERDVQFAYNQITTCLAADLVIFNSLYNKNSFLENLKNVVKLLPDYKPKNLKSEIEPKCKVIYFPIEFPLIQSNLRVSADAVLHIVWPHRWEFDKDPDLLIRTLIRLKTDGFDFCVSILGETFTEVPDILIQAKETLKDQILHYGYMENKNDYYSTLQKCHVAVSTARHEFFGVSMLEATYCGCYPLAPNSLVYPEIYPVECLYSNEGELYLRLRDFCINPKLASESRERMRLDFRKYSLDCLLSDYKELFCSV